MNSYPASYSNVTGMDVRTTNLKITWRALILLLDRANRVIRKNKGLNFGDALFNFIKLSFLQNTIVKYRRLVRFEDKVMLDSTFPPFPSRAFDRRISNYINNLDLTELPSGIISISTTNCCPYSCAFCSTNARHNTDTDLDEDLIKQTIRQAEDLGVATLILHGGEPMYRYDRFLRLVKHVNKDTCLWMFTTGYGVTVEKAAELKANGLFGVWVSLDHYLPDVHNRMRGNPEAFENACRAVDHFRRAGVYTCLSLVPPPDFLETENFKKYYDLAKDLGVAEIRVMEVKPSGREACRGVIPHSSVLEQLQKDLFKDPAYRNHPPLSGLSTWLEKDPALGCQCRFEYLFITSTGEVQPCEATEISFGNIKDEPFPEIYRRVCKAFPQPSTGCIPMVMYSEVRDYHKIKDDLSSREKSVLSTRIMRGFHEKGFIPGAYRSLWSIYQSRLKAYHSRLSAKRLSSAQLETKPHDT
ncbi:MAG: radical SAM protein [Desulfomonile tiedjei]|uniref:Radical SAM protein n=1 Tax=Desulfomonile tiedjei TaxID=2358 RepID=A0A9D6V3Q4_9BACT|nr:radical SAM protein [Desulfomonile tiedjei]